MITGAGTIENRTNRRPDPDLDSTSNPIAEEEALYEYRVGRAFSGR